MAEAIKQAREAFDRGVVFYREFQSFFLSDDDDEFSSAGDRGIDEVSLKKEKMLHG